MGTSTSYNISSLAPMEYSNFTSDNFICIASFSNRSTKTSYHKYQAPVPYPKLTWVSAGCSCIYTPSSGKLNISTSGSANLIGGYESYSTPVDSVSLGVTVKTFFVRNLQSL